MLLRLIIALLLSLILHGSLLTTDLLKASSPPPAAIKLRALLRPPPEQAKPPELSVPPPPDVDPLIKNTIEEEPSKTTEPESRPKPPAEEKTPRIANKEPVRQQKIQAIQKKLAQYIHYPEQARQQGLEGTVELFIELDNDGRVQDVHVITSTGFPILDNAAIKGVYAVGHFPGGKSGVWFYTFHLE